MKDIVYRLSIFIGGIVFIGTTLISALFFSVPRTAAVATYSYLLTNLQLVSCSGTQNYVPSNLISPGDRVTILGTGFGNRSVSDGTPEMLYMPINEALKMVYRGQRDESGPVYFGLHAWSDNAIDIEVAEGHGGTLGSYIILRRYDPPENITSTCVSGSLSITCDSSTYSDWGACQPDGTQTRTIISSSPSSCSVINPILSQSCTYAPPACTSFTYSDWSTCSNGQQMRSITSSSPNNCTGGSPILSQSCTPICTINDYSCGEWDSCSADGAQIRTCTKNSNCESGVSMPSTSQSCTYTAPVCTSWTYSDWGTCSTNGQQTRTIISATPVGCAGGNPTLSQTCTPSEPICTNDTWSCADWSSCSADSLQTRTCTKTNDCPNVDTPSPAISQSCTYVPPAPKIAPVITSISPDPIEKGTLVTLRGSKFMNLEPFTFMVSCSNCKVLINGSEVSGISAYSWYEDHVSFSMPSNAASGYIQVQDSKENISEKFNFTIKTFADQNPISITSVFPATAIPGELITITGSGFGTTWYSDTSVTVGGIDITLVVSWSDTKIELFFPIEGRFGEKVRIKKCKTSWSTTTDECSYAASNETISLKKHSEDLLSGFQWYLENINVPQAWQITQGSSNVVVAVIDSGVDTNHEDLTHSIWLNQREIENNGIDDDNNGYKDDKKGWNFAENTPEMTVHNDHGTGVAGIIAAKKDNLIGITGIAPNVKIMGLTVLDKDGYGNQADIKKAIKYAVDNGANIINLSLGGVGFTTDYNPDYNNVFQYAYDHNVLVIAAAGNGDLLGQDAGYTRGQNLDVNPSSPVCNDSNKNLVIGVGASDKNKLRAIFSNYGICVDVWAPGVEIATTAPPPTDYNIYDGTSESTPMVAGIAALVKSLHPDWNVEEIKTVLINSATDGVIDAYKAVTAIRPNAQYQPSTFIEELDTTKFQNEIITVNPDEGKVEKPIVVNIPFPDIEVSKYQEAINILKEKEFVKGYPDGTFKPFNTLNRAEFLTILMHQLPQEIPAAPQNGCGFKDVKTSDWFAKSICFAKSQGYAKGYPDGTFKPGNPVNFVEALALTERIFGWSISEDKEEWFRPFVIYAEAKNIIPDSINSFGQKITREEMAELVVRFIKDKEGSLDSYLGTKSLRITYVCLKNGTCNTTDSNQNTHNTSPSRIEVIYPSVRIRNGIGYGAVILETATLGQQFEIIDEKSGWYQIKRASGEIGWIEGKWVKRID